MVTQAEAEDKEGELEGSMLSLYDSPCQTLFLLPHPSYSRSSSAHPCLEKALANLLL